MNMKIIVAHLSPDIDAISSVWIIRKFLNGWENAVVKFVPAGDRIDLSNEMISPEDYTDVIETIGEDEVIHVDTGLGPLDHHQTLSDNVCAASLTFDFVRRNSKIKEEKIAALERMVKVIVDIDHFKEVYKPDPTADYHEFDLEGLLQGLKYQYPGQDDLFVDFISKCLEAILYNFESRIWAEKEIKEKGIEFEIKQGKALGIETMNDDVIKFSQLMGYALVVKKDPRAGNIRIKSTPKTTIDLTPVYEEIKKTDTKASWFLHVGKRMLLNGSSKNTKAVPSSLSLSDIIDILKKIYG